MAKENGGVIGKINFTTQNYAVGAFTIKSHFNANYNAQWPRSGSVFLAVAHNTTPFVSVYPFSTLGFGAKLANPATLPTGNGSGVTFSSNGKTLVVAHATTPFVSAYPFSGSGIGSKYSDPATLPVSAGLDVGFRPQGDAVAISFNTTPFIHVYAWSNGFGSKFTNPATLPTSGYAVTFAPNGNDIAIGSGALIVYPWSSSGFGTKYTDHASNLTASVNYTADLSFHPNGGYIAVGYNSSGTISSTRIERTYGFTSGTGFTSTFYDTSTSGATLGATSATGSDIAGVDFSPSGNDVVFATTGSSVNYVRAYSFNTSTGYTAKYADPATNTTGAPNRSKFSPDGAYLASVHATTPFVTAWPWTSGTGFGTKLTNPATLPASTGNDLAWGVV